MPSEAESPRAPGMAPGAPLERDKVLSWLGHYIKEITPEMAAEDDWYASALTFEANLRAEIEVGTFSRGAV